LAKRKKEVYKIRAERKAKGLCRNCRKPVEARHVYCPSCLQKVNDQIKAIWSSRTIQGLCGRCGQKPIFKNEECQECYQKSTGYHKTWQTALRLRQVCVVCQKPSYIYHDGTVARYCLQHMQKYQWPQIKKYWDRKTKGLCVACGQPVEPDMYGHRYARCSKCLAKHQDCKLRRKLGYPRMRKKFEIRKYEV
jgi:hypothetical protein